MFIFHSLLPFFSCIAFIQGFVIKNLMFGSSMNRLHSLSIESKTTDFRSYPTSYQVSKPENTHSEVAILLIHGFGSSSYHWRDNIPALSENYDTYAIDLIGFGKSAKPATLNYTVSLWCEQVTEFIDCVIQKPCIIVANSLGGYIALYTAAYSSSNIKGVIPINPVIISQSYSKIRLPPIFNWFSTKSIIKGYFHLTKQRPSIQCLFKMLYPVFPERVDDSLIDSIENPSKHPNASDVFYGIVKENIMSQTVFIEDIVENLDPKIPVSIIYGTKDPWIPGCAINYFMKLSPNTQIFRVPAGHCPQDEIPEIVNPIIESFMTNVK